jgi:aminoglycoside 6-adenylyltransferase
MRISEVRSQILDFARCNENIRLVVETGAFAREFPPADELSDLDIEFYALNPRILLESRDWISQFGAILICLELENNGFNPTRLVIYESGAKVDFSIYDAALLEKGFRSPAQNRGCIVHFDCDGWTQNWQQIGPEQIQKPDEKVWRALIDDFWLDFYNQAKYLARGDGWTAKLLDAEIKNYVLQMLEWHASAKNGADVWHLGHHMKSWTDAATYKEIGEIFADFEVCNSWRALLKTGALFSRLARNRRDLGTASSRRSRNENFKSRPPNESALTCAFGIVFEPSDQNRGDHF